MSAFKPFENDSQSVGLGGTRPRIKESKSISMVDCNVYIDKQSLANGKTIARCAGVKSLHIWKPINTNGGKIYLNNSKRRVDEVNNPFYK